MACCVWAAADGLLLLLLLCVCCCAEGAHERENSAGSLSLIPLVRFMPKKAGTMVVAITLMFSMDSQRFTMMMWLRLVSSCMCQTDLAEQGQPGSSSSSSSRRRDRYAPGMLFCPVGNAERRGPGGRSPQQIPCDLSSYLVSGLTAGCAVWRFLVHCPCCRN